MPRNTQNSRTSACDSHPAEASAPAPQRRARSRRGVSFSDEQTAAVVAGRAEQEKRKAEEKQQRLEWLAYLKRQKAQEDAAKRA